MDFRLEEIQQEHEAAYLTTIKPEWSTFQFRNFLKECERERMDWRPKPGKISVTHYVMLDSIGQIFATANLRFPLNEESEKDGGNLRVEVPPMLRGQGHGSYALSLLLFEAVRAGLSRALCTCSASDQSARRMIEKNRGQLLDLVASPLRTVEIARYWISFR